MSLSLHPGYDYYDYDCSLPLLCRPREGGDPYAVLSPRGTAGEMQNARWLWVPAFAGTTPRELRSPFLALAHQERLRIAGEAADRAQRHMADDARDTELRIVDQAVGELLIAGQVGADETRHIV